MIERGARSPSLPRPRGGPLAPPASPFRVARSIALAAILLATGSAATLAAAAPAPVPVGGAGAAERLGPAALAEWTGGVNLYQDGVFTTQASWLYCTAADIQIIRNILEGTEDHAGSAQTTYFDWMRTNNQYDLPLSAGIDPAGWTAGMRHFLDDRYRLVASSSFGHSLQLAAARMRLTGLPVAITVAHGNHGWVLHGFTATADPAVTADFEVTTVSVTGPLWGLQSKGGYDMPPNTTLTVDELRTFFTRWHYDPLPMVWDGTFVSIQPLTDEELAAPAPTPPTIAPTPSPDPEPTPAIATSEPSATPAPDVALGGATGGPTVGPRSAGEPAAAASGTWPAIAAVLLLVAAGVIAVARLVARRPRN